MPTTVELAFLLAAAIVGLGISLAARRYDRSRPELVTGGRGIPPYSYLGLSGFFVVQAAYFGYSDGWKGGFWFGLIIAAVFLGLYFVVRNRRLKNRRDEGPK